MAGVSSCGGGRRLSLCGGDLEGFFVWGGGLYVAEGIFMWRRPEGVSVWGVFMWRRVSLCGGGCLCVAGGVFA